MFVDLETESAEVSLVDSTLEGPGGALAPMDLMNGVTGQDYVTPGSPGQVRLLFDTSELGGTVEVVLQCVTGCDGEVFLSLPLD
ncbi:hypothetical protein [Nocardiopsis sp. NPDC006938]|uniref:hypothetical protein n=1 Tax=Nocardiopsis sp. NPDC006938 TaxID=3364337 RepID=UPI0036AF084A